MWLKNYRIKKTKKIINNLQNSMFESTAIKLLSSLPLVIRVAKGQNLYDNYIVELELKNRELIVFEHKESKEVDLEAANYILKLLEV